jgi:hypothetical protein
MIEKFKVKHLIKIYNNENRSYDDLLKEILELSDEEVDNYDILEWEDLITQLKGIDRSGKFNNIESSDYYFKSPTTWTLAEYIDSKTFISNGRLDLFLCIFWRKKGEQWGFPLNERMEYMNNLSVKYFYQCEDIYMKFENDISKSYPMLFENDDDNDEQPPEDVVDKRMMMQIKTERIKREQLKRDGWNHIIWGLCNNDVTKWDSILKTPYLRILTVLKLEKIKSK